MNRALPYKTKQFFFVLIKFSIVVGAFYFIYQKLTTNDNLDIQDFVQFLTKNDVFSSKNMIFLLLLTLFNWFFEILKWRALVSTIKYISFKNSLEQSLGALTASLFTPNRIGDYGAKAMYFKSLFRKRVVLINLLGHMWQMSTTLIFGVIGFYIFISTYEIDINYYRASRFLMIVLIVSLFAVFGIKQTRFKIKGFSTEKVFEFIKQMPLKIHVSSFILSICRYLIFSFQFYFLLTIFGIDVSYIDAMVVITSMYLLASIIPSIFIFDVVIKGSVAVYLFSIVEVNEFTVLCIVTIMWLLNFVIPSFFGSYFVMKFKLPKPKSP